MIDGDAPDGVLTLEQVVAAPDPDFDAEASVAQLGAQDLLTIIYTSGTTGPPKGVQLSHRNLLAAVEPASRSSSTSRRDGRVISWLPSRPRRRAQRPPLPADRLRAAGHLLRQPARDPRLPARGPARRGSSPCRASGRSSRPASRRWSPASPTSSAPRRRPRCATHSRRSASSRRGEEVPADLAERVAAGRPRDLRRPAHDAGPRPGQGDPRRRGADAGRGARVLPRHRAAAGRAVGHERDVRRGRGQPAREDQDRHRRARRRPVSRSSSPRTARSSSAATS